jgi:hypothetical protein
MKMAQVTKLYSGLTGHEKAAMAFEAVARGDISTCNDIVASMPMQSYIGVDIDYRERVNGITLLALYYGIFWYQQKSLLIYGEGKDDVTDIMQRLAAIHYALVEVCDKYHVDIDSVKITASCRNEVVPTWFAPPERIAEYSEMFTTLIK